MNGFKRWVGMIAVLGMMALAGCVSQAQVQMRADAQAATLTAGAGLQTATAAAARQQATGTAAALAVAQAEADQAYLAAALRVTQLAMTQTAASAATQAAAEATRQAQELERQSRQATAQAQSQERTQAVQATGTAQAWVVVQATLEAGRAAGTSTAQAGMAQATGTAQAAAWYQGQTQEAVDLAATVSAGQARVLEADAMGRETERALTTRRAEAINEVAPWGMLALVGVVVAFLLWLAWRLGRVEAVRQGVVTDPRTGAVLAVLDERSGRLAVMLPGRSVGPALISAGNQVATMEVGEAVQAEVTRRDQVIGALRALPETLASERLARQALQEGQPIEAPAVLRMTPERVDWGELGRRPAGTLLLGAGSEGLVTARQDTPHVLVAGQTGSGKSTAMRSIITQHLLDGRRVTVLDKSGRDYEVFQGWARVITIDAQDPQEAIERLMRYMRAAWTEVIRRLPQSRPVWRGVVDVLVIDELDNWQDIGLDAETSAKRLWQFPRMISREGRASGIYLLAASQNPTAQNISIDMRRNCTPVAFRLADAAASRIIIDTPEAVGLPTGHFIASLQERVRGVGFNPNDEQIRAALRGVPRRDPAEWLEAELAQPSAQEQAGELERLRVFLQDHPMASRNAMCLHLWKQPNAGWYTSKIEALLLRLQPGTGPVGQQ